jgi:hypothetical protein
MRDAIDMARESKLDIYGLGCPHDQFMEKVKAFEALVRADEREQGQKWFDAVTAQNKQLILAEREACAKVCEELAEKEWADNERCAAAIRARRNT